MKIKKRHQFMVSFFRFGGKIYLGLKYHFHCKKNKLEKKKNRASESCRTVTRDLNVRVISISEREEKEDRAEKEIVPEIFPTLSKDTQETQQISVRMNPKKFTPRHIKVRLQKTEANFKKC